MRTRLKTSTVRGVIRGNSMTWTGRLDVMADELARDKLERGSGTASLSGRTL